MKKTLIYAVVLFIVGLGFPLIAKQNITDIILAFIWAMFLAYPFIAVVFKHKHAPKAK